MNKSGNIMFKKRRITLFGKERTIKEIVQDCRRRKNRKFRESETEGDNKNKDKKFLRRKRDVRIISWCRKKEKK